MSMNIHPSSIGNHYGGTFEGAVQFDDVAVAEVSEDLYFLLDVFPEVWLLRELLLVDALH